MPFLEIEIVELYSGRSMISQTGVPTPKVEAPTYYLAKCFGKLHENEKKYLTERGRASLAPPPLDPPKL